MTYQNRIQYISMALVIAAAISIVLLQRNAPKVYEGIGEGFENEIRVQVTAYRNRENEIRITDIQVEHEDTPEVGGMAISSLTEKIKSMQTLDVDVVAGASSSSQGFLDAIRDAVKKYLKNKE
ncbi:FMN-binding protein [Fusobacterium necrophorum subsp. funduliforme B35]|uniref:FMN-binding protein n=1 Tax=Fusobacterium necrophorum subsp. funduliforme B35 TaxID=1226633 RepID=A0A0B4FNV3_9FUSO|nr:FMN-binding protein [Fusobacterium necrophorum subsp. funduliforme B35]